MKDLRQDNEKGKACPGSKKQSGPEYNSHDGISFSGMQSWSYKHPELIDEDRNAENYTNEERKFEVRYKCFCEICIDKLDNLRLGRKKGRHEEPGNLLCKEIGKNCKEKYCSK